MSLTTPGGMPESPPAITISEGEGSQQEGFVGEDGSVLTPDGPTPFQPLLGAREAWDEVTLRRMMRCQALYGTVLLLVGISVLVIPLVTPWQIDHLLGISSVVTGIAAVAVSFLLDGIRGMGLLAVVGSMDLIMAAYLLLASQVDVQLYRTLILSVWYIAQGCCKVGLSYSIRLLLSAWPAVFASGLLSVVFGFWVLALLPDDLSSYWILTLFLGTNALVTGIAALLVSIMAFLGGRTSFRRLARRLDEEEGFAPRASPSL
eukprot:TRINITY_DN11722_c0_g2_i1.p1 TRINITY_DN11722_c0_g2~~TRINITY_DN11722_c0_g2_i1.p1  ORF type:complete len:261 (-),score=53.71 TRINITY_DN11722_c0_g2_i1:584-1366(-)